MSELLHDDISFDLIHLSVHNRNYEILLSHNFLEFFNSLLCVTVDESLIDVKVGIKVQKNLNFPLFFLNSDVVLVNTFKCELLILDQDLSWFSHEMLSQFQDLWRQCS